MSCGLLQQGGGPESCFRGPRVSDADLQGSLEGRAGTLPLRLGLELGLELHSGLRSSGHTLRRSLPKHSTESHRRQKRMKGVDNLESKKEK